MEPGQPEGRLRPHPSQRFAGPEHRFDLNQTFDDLLAEPKPAPHGHRQEAIYRHGPVSIVLFHFERGAEMTDHAAAGLVTLQTLKGRLKVRTAGQVHDLPEQTLLVLASGVRHSVTAEVESRMLLTVHLDNAESHSERD